MINRNDTWFWGEPSLYKTQGGSQHAYTKFHVKKGISQECSFLKFSSLPPPLRPIVGFSHFYLTLHLNVEYIGLLPANLPHKIDPLSSPSLLSHHGATTNCVSIAAQWQCIYNVNTVGDCQLGSRRPRQIVSLVAMHIQCQYYRGPLARIVGGHARLSVQVNQIGQTK